MLEMTVVPSCEGGGGVTALPSGAYGKPSQRLAQKYVTLRNRLVRSNSREPEENMAVGRKSIYFLARECSSNTLLAWLSLACLLGWAELFSGLCQ